MKRCITLTVTLAALIVAAPVHAYHALPGDPHWPTTTVQVNGGSCGFAKPECRWLKIIDHTGYGTTWQNTTLPNALVALSAATGYRFNFTVTRGTRFDLWTQTEPSPCDGPCEGVFHWDEAYAQTPIGAVFVARNAYHTSWRTCDNDGFPQPYCGTDPHHTTRAVIGAGAVASEASYTFKHEMGHALGLAHRTGTDGASIMVGYDWWPNFDAHDKAELARLYGHTP